ALVHRDAAELVLENLHRIEDGVGPVAHPGVQATSGHEEQRKATSGFLITDPDVTLLVKRHALVSQRPRQANLPWISFVQAGFPVKCRNESAALRRVLTTRASQAGH